MSILGESIHVSWSTYIGLSIYFVSFCPLAFLDFVGKCKEVSVSAEK